MTGFKMTFVPGDLQTRNASFAEKTKKAPIGAFLFILNKFLIAYF